MDVLLFYKISSLLNALVATVLALVVYFRNRKQLVNKLFSLFFAVVAIWSYAYFFWFTIKDKDLALFDYRIFVLGAAIFISILFFHSVLAFTNKIQKYKKFLVVGYLIFSFLLAMDYFTSLVLKDFRKELFFDFWPTPGIFYHLYIVAWHFYLITALYVLIKEIKTPNISNYYKTQLQYLVIGAIIGFIGSIPNNFWWYTAYVIPIAPLANLLVTIGMIIVAYSIVKHNLFNIKLLVSEILVFSIWTFVVIRAVLSNNTQELLANGILVILIFIMGILLLRSVSKEAELDRRLLQEAQKNLELEQGLRKEFTHRAGQIIKRMESIVQDSPKNKKLKNQ